MRGRSLIVLSAIGLTGLVGCAAIPASSDIQVVRSMPVGSQLTPPLGPERGVDPFRLVRGFIEATGSPANGHAAARAFLSRDAAARWDDQAGVTVIEDAPGAAPLTGPSDEVRHIRVGGAQLGMLTADGSFVSAAGSFSVPLDVVIENGEWRITNPPQGVLVEATALQRNYRQVRVSFIDPNRGTIVPDLRWVPAQPASTLPGRVLNLMLAGPSQRLAGAVRSAIPDGVRLRDRANDPGPGRLLRHRRHQPRVGLGRAEGVRAGAAGLDGQIAVRDLRHEGPTGRVHGDVHRAAGQVRRG